MRRYGKSRALPAPPQQTLSPSLLTNTIDNKRIVTRGLYLRDESGLCPGGNTVPRFGPDGQMLFSAVSVDSCGNMIIPGNLTVGAGADICGDLIVDGSGSIAGDLNVSGDTYLQQNIFVDGSGYIGGDLNISGDTYLQQDVFVGGTFNASNIQVNGVVDISGDLTVDRIHVRQYIDDATKVTSVNTDKVRAIEVFVGSESLFPPVDVTPGYALDVSGSALVRSRLDVSGGVHVAGNLDVSGDAVFSGDARFEGEVDISGAIVFKSTVTVWGETDLCSNLIVAGDIDVMKTSLPAIAVNTPGGRRGSMYWNTNPANDCLTFNTVGNAYPIEIQGSIVNVTSAVSVNGSGGGRILMSTPSGTYGNIAMNGYFSAFPTGAALSGTPSFQIASDGATIATIYNDQPYANRALNPFVSQFQLSGKTTSNRLYAGTYYTGGSGTCGSIQASDYFSGADHGTNLLLNPIGGYVGVNTSSPAAPLDVSGTARVNVIRAESILPTPLQFTLTDESLVVFTINGSANSYGEFKLSLQNSSISLSIEGRAAGGGAPLYYRYYFTQATGTRSLTNMYFISTTGTNKITTNLATWETGTVASTDSAKDAIWIYLRAGTYYWTSIGITSDIAIYSPEISILPMQLDADSGYYDSIAPIAGTYKIQNI